MRTRWLAAVSVLVFMAALALPTSAVAKTSKAYTFLRLTSTEPSIAVGATETAVSGRLMYQKAELKNHKRVWVNAGYKGTVYLNHYSMTLRTYVVVAKQTTTNGGYFNLEATSPGYYVVRYHGSGRAQPCAWWLEVQQSGLGLSKPTVSATLDASGNAFVRASTVVTAPAGVLSTSTPGIVVLDAWAGEPEYPLGSTVTAAASEPGVFRAFCQESVIANGTYTMGFIVPPSSFDDTMTLTADVQPYYSLWYASASTTTSFTVSSLLGP